MSTPRLSFLLMAGVLSLPTLSPAQGNTGFFSPEGSFTVEVSLEAASGLRLPIYRNSITSLEVVGDHVIGGTSARAGLSPFLFAVSLPQRELVVALDVARIVPGQRSIQSGFGRGPDGWLYAGTMPDRQGEGGHLIKARLRNTGAQKEIEAADLGVAVAGEGVFALAIDPSRHALYGVCHPSGRFFAYDLTTGQASVFEETAGTVGFWLDPSDYLCRRLVLDRHGRVYGSKPGGRIFRFDPGTRQITELAEPIPGVWNREALGTTESWAVAPDGMLYGGNGGEGLLFKLDPETGRVTNLGKPIMMPHLRGLAFGSDGKLYGVVGGEPYISHLFSYDPKEGGFQDLGTPRFKMVAPGIEQGISWRGFQLASLAASEDARVIVLGEGEALSQLMVFPVGTPSPARAAGGKRSKAGAISSPDAPAARQLTREAVLTVTRRAAEWQLANPSRHNPGDWAAAPFHHGLMALATVSGDARFHDAALAIARELNWTPIRTQWEANDHCAIQSFVLLYLQHRDPAMLAPSRQRLDQAMLATAQQDDELTFTRKNYGKWSWCDALYMSPPAYALMAEATGDRKYLDYLNQWWWKLSAFLYDRNESLFFRDQTFFARREANGARVFWSRGNGWVFAGLARVLQHLPADYPERVRYVAQFREMAARLVALQQPDGFWHASLLDPQTYADPETSGTAFYVYGLAWGVNAGLLDAAKHRPVAEKGWRALTTAVQPDGRLGFVQKIGASPVKVRPEDTESYGVGAFLLAGSEVARMVGGDQ